MKMNNDEIRYLDGGPEDMLEDPRVKGVLDKYCGSIYRNKYYCMETKGHQGHHRAELFGGILVPDGQRSFVRWE